MSRPLEAAERSEASVSLPPWVIAFVLVPVLGVLYWRIVVDMVIQWANDPNYSHGFVVPLFSGYLVWQSRAELSRLPLAGSSSGVAVLLFGLAMLALGVVGSELFLMRSSLVVVLAGIVLFHAGWSVFRVLCFPLAFLFFMIPLPTIVFNAIAFPLQTLAAKNATWTLDVLGVPVLRDGNVIHLSHVTLGVVEACSGIRSLISLLAVAVVWAHLAVPGIWSQILFVAAAVPITIVANAGRIVLTGLIAQGLGVEYAMGFFHGFSGWIIFIVAFLCLLGVHGLIGVGRRLGPRGAAV